MNKLKKHGTKSFEPGFGIEWWLFSSDVSDDEALGAAEPPYYGDPGGLYIKKPNVRRTKTRVLVTQRFGLDV